MFEADDDHALGRRIYTHGKSRGRGDHSDAGVGTSKFLLHDPSLNWLKVGVMKSDAVPQVSQQGRICQRCIRERHSGHCICGRGQPKVTREIVGH